MHSATGVDWGFWLFRGVGKIGEGLLLILYFNYLFINLFFIGVVYLVSTSRRQIAVLNVIPSCSAQLPM